MTAAYEAMSADDEVMRQVDHYVDTLGLSYGDAWEKAGVVPPIETESAPLTNSPEAWKDRPTMREILDTPLTAVGPGRKAAREMTIAVGSGNLAARETLLKSNHLRSVVIEQD